MMNYLTGTYAVSLFPITTFFCRITLTCQDMTTAVQDQAAWIERYRRYGLAVYGSADRFPKMRDVHTWSRRVGDRLTWIIPYNRKSTSLYHYHTLSYRTLLPAIGVTRTLSVDRYAFEVLSGSDGTVPAGAALRVGPRFYYRYVYSTQQSVRNHAELCYL